MLTSAARPVSQPGVKRSAAPLSCQARSQPGRRSLPAGQRPQTPSRTPARQTTCHGLPATALAVAPTLPGGLSVEAICHVAATCVIIGACVRNVPQLVACWRQKSAEGLSLAALVTEVSCYAAAVAYGTRSGYLPTVWGSDLACHAQDSLVIATIAVLRKLPVLQTSVLVAAWLALQATLFTPVIPLAILAKFQVVVGLVLGLGARVPQIILNFRQGHTGTLAAATFTFNAASNVVNGTIATLLTGDVYIIGTQIWMFFLNVTVLGQILAGRRKAGAAQQRLVQRVSYDSMDGEMRSNGKLGFA